MRTAVAVLALAVVACGPATHGPTGSAESASPARQSSPGVVPTAALTNPPVASQSRTHCPGSSPGPVYAPSGPSSRQLALVKLGSSNDFIVRDVTDISRPFTVANLDGQVDYASKFVNATELSTTVGGHGLIRMSLSGSSRTVAAPCATSLFAWSPDGSTAAYLVEQDYPAPWLLHILSGGVDRAVDLFPGIPPVGCESRGCGDNWQVSLLFSPDGRYISMVLLQGMLRLWTSDGRLVKSFESGATMQLWSGNTLYWRDATGVEAWRDCVQSTVLPGVSWIRPKASSAGGAIVFETRDSGYTTAHVFILDIATRTTRLIASSRSEPAFLTSRYLWYQAERPCSPADCLTPTTTTGATYLYDLQSGVEAQSIITNVWDVWPHPA